MSATAQIEDPSSDDALDEYSRLIEERWLEDERLIEERKRNDGLLGCIGEEERATLEAEAREQLLSMRIPSALIKSFMLRTEMLSILKGRKSPKSIVLSGS